MSSQQSQSWSRDAIVALIDAYKQESGLYDVSSANYHNKHLRAEALTRVSTAVRNIRAETSEKECAAKFYNMRNQFNIENNKVKASIKSGTGTENIYKPTLWYFEYMKFVEEHVVPRKSVSSKLPFSRSTVKVPEINRTPNPSAGRSVTISSEGFSANGELNVFVDEYSDMSSQDEPRPSNTADDTTAGSSGHTSSSFTVQIGQAQAAERASYRSAPAASQSSTTSRPSSQSSQSSSPSTSSSMTDNSSTVLFPQTCARSQKRRKIPTDDAYVSAISSIAETLKQPVAIPVPNNPSSSTDPIDACMTFIGSLLKGFESSELRLEVMNTLVQTVINARTAELERTNRK